MNATTSALRIAVVAPPWYSVPPRGYGGIELVVYLLADELVRRGHDVTVFGRQGSHGPFETIALAPESWQRDLGSRDHPARETAYLYRVYESVRHHAFDVVHDNTGHVGTLVASLATGPAVLVETLHGDLTEADGEFLAQIDDHVRLVAISQAQQSTVAGVHWAGVVHNAVDIGALECSGKKEGYLLELARISPNKGQHLAIRVARRAGRRLILAGKVGPADQDYFKQQIEPELGDGVEWIENVAGRDKARLLGGADAMLFPIQWPEPFGLAMAEAMASGTPVIAFALGAAIEVVEPGVTGYLADDEDAMHEALGRLGDIDPARCAQVARERFSASRMGQAYEEIYRAAIQQTREDPIVA